MCWFVFTCFGLCVCLSFYFAICFACLFFCVFCLFACACACLFVARPFAGSFVLLVCVFPCLACLLVRVLTYLFFVYHSWRLACVRQNRTALTRIRRCISHITPLGRFSELDCSTTKRVLVPTPNDTSSECSRRDVPNADLFGTDTTPTVEISTMGNRPRGV